MPEDLECTIAKYQKQEQEKKNAAKAALLALVNQLRAAGVSQVCAVFNGYGDEGSIESIQFLDADGQPVALKEQFPKLEPTFWPLLPCGFEDNDGSSGTVCLDVEQGSIVVDIDWSVRAGEKHHHICRFDEPQGV